MSVLLYLLPIALAFGLTGLFAVVWALRNGQSDGIGGVSLRILSDDDA